MLNYDMASLKIRISEQDIYGMGDMSATGKTYLSTLLRTYSTDLSKKDIVVCMFSTANEYTDFEKKYEDIPAGSLVILDRADQFMSLKNAAVLDKRRDELYTLISIKRGTLFCVVDRYVKLELSENALTVEG